MKCSETTYISKLCKLCGDLFTAGDLQETLQVLTKGCTEALKVKACSIRILDEKGQNLEIRAAHGLSQDYLKKGPVRVSESPLDQECLAGTPVNISDVNTEPRVRYREEIKREGISSVLYVPLSVKTRSIGLLRVYSSLPHRFTPDEVDFLSALANQVATAIENARLFEHMKRDYEDLTQNVWK